MIKYLYLFITIVIGVNLIEGIPVLDIFSSSWHVVCNLAMAFVGLVSMFGLVFIWIGYVEEKDNLSSEFVEFFLRKAIGQKFLPKWPLFIWLGMLIGAVQFNNLFVAFTFGLITALGFSVVFVHNSLYTLFLKEEAKG